MPSKIDNKHGKENELFYPSNFIFLARERGAMSWKIDTIDVAMNMAGDHSWSSQHKLISLGRVVADEAELCPLFSIGSRGLRIRTPEPSGATSSSASRIDITKIFTLNRVLC